MKYDVVIIGAGPAGIFTAIELIRKGANKKIMMVERVSRLKSAAAPNQRPTSASTASPIAT